MEHGAPKINVLMVSFATQGHMNPMLRLAKQLQSKANIQVTLATTEIFYHHLLKQNNHNVTTTTSNNTLSISGIDFESFPDGFDLDYDRKSNLNTYLDTLAKVGPTNLYNLIISLSTNQISPKKFSCIITSPFVPWATNVAVRLRIPCAMLWIQPCTLFAIYHSYYNNLNYFPTKENPHISVKLPCLPLLEASDLPSIVLPENPITGMNESLSQAVKNVDNIRWVLANSFYELEKEVVEYLSKFVDIKAVGPLVPPTVLLGEEHCHGNDDHVGINLWKPEDKCIDWLKQNKDNSVIYVSFGSVIMLSREQLEIIGKALINCKRPFLWVVKEKNYSVSEGAREFLEWFLDETKEQGMVVKWCSQDKVLSHKSLGCFLTHCGWNSMLETISVGVPVIAYPFWTDQPTNAKLMCDLFGVGLRLWPNKDGLVGVEEIMKCIEVVMDGPRAVEFRAKAAEWKNNAREVVVHGGSSDRNIQDFVDDIIQTSSAVKYNVDTE
ncbi:UDP-glycosyltransferase 84B2-like [Silene latifolia]|uniref:UDP-glycosyltransferase 84B2-like n=1 Tax=Silene latifolia TaxID=37657 RepID=UPI003D773505